MAISLERKRALFWLFGIATLFVLTNLAWTEIARAVGHCLSPF